MDAELSTLLAQLDDDALSELFADPDEQGGLLNQQMARANALRSTPMPEAQMVGGRYIKPGLGQQLGSVAQRFMGGMQTGDIENQQQDLLKQQVAAKIKALRMAAGPQPEAPQMAGQMMPDDLA